MLGNTKITAIVPVTDLARARDFYEGVLGLNVDRVDERGPGVLYRSGDSTLLIYERATPSSGEHTIAGFNIEGDFDAVADGLIARGVTFDTWQIPGVEMPWDDRGVLSDDTMKSAWFKDPDGNVLNIVQEM